MKDKENQRRLWREWYQRNKKSQQKKIYARRKKLKEAKRKLIDELKSKPCKDCGNTYPTICMDFDHLKDKSFNISEAVNRDGLSLKSITEEISKCELVCSNCHRIRTFTRRLVVDHLTLNQRADVRPVAGDPN